MNDYIPPAGWRVKGDDEEVSRDDVFSHDYTGKPWPDLIARVFQIGCCGGNVKNARSSFMPNGGYILTPIVSSPSTPQPDVSPEQHTDDMDGWEIYEPVVGEPYSPGTEYRYQSWTPKNWQKTAERMDTIHKDHGHGFIYRRPIQKQQPARQPLDIDLLSVERKINLAAKDRPDLLDWWRGAKETLAIEAGKRIGGGM